MSELVQGRHGPVCRIVKALLGAFVATAHRRLGLAAALVMAIAAGTLAPLTSLRADEPATAGYDRRVLPGHQLPLLPLARRLAPAKGGHDDAEPVTLTVVLNREDEPGFQAWLTQISDPASPNYRRFLSPSAIADRYGPTLRRYRSVRAWFERAGFAVTADASNRLTMSVRAPRDRIEPALRVSIQDFELDGRQFLANTDDPSLPAEIAGQVQAIVGLSTLAQPQHIGGAHPLISLTVGNTPSCNSVEQAFLDLANLLGDADTSFLDWGAYAASLSIQCLLRLVQEHDFQSTLPSAWPRQAPLGPLPAVPPGTGQKIGLLEYDGYRASDVADFLAYYRQSAGQGGRLSEHRIDGGATIGAGESEVLLDLGAVMLSAPGAEFHVYDAPFSTSFQALFNQMIGDGMTVISNSWTYCEDQTTLADVQSLDTIFAAAAASGISILNGSGDTGSTCFDGSPLTIGVPADAPHATAVGGASLSFDPHFVYRSAAWWHGNTASPPSGEGGFGTSRYFVRPSYQNPLSAAAMRSIPDLVAPADPASSGLALCQADRGGCPTGFVIGGTSLAAPLLAAHVANINARRGSNSGWLNPALYALAGSGAFESPLAMASDFAHAGLGLPHVNALALALLGQAAGPADATQSRMVAPASVYADGSAGQIVIFLRDANGDAVPAKTVTLTKNGGSATIGPASGPSSPAQGAVLFTVSDSVIEDVVFTAHVSGGVDINQTALVHFVSPRATAGGIQAAPTMVTADGTSTTTITVTLLDANGNGTPGKRVSLSQGDSSSVIAQTTALTNSAGQVQFTASDFIAESVAYTATDVTDGLPVPGNASVNFVNATGFCATYGHAGLASAAPGFAVSTFAGNFANDCFTNIGPIGVQFDPAGRLLVSNSYDNYLYRFGPEGGSADVAHRVGPVTVGNPHGLSFTADGRLYAAVGTGSKVVELDPATAATLRTVANYTNATALAVDPLSGDLFVSNFDGVARISNYSAGPGTVSSYLAGGFVDGIVFAPDGTLYVKGGADGGIYRVTGTNLPQPAVATLITNLPGSPDGLGLQVNPSNPARPFIYANRNDGTMTRIDQSVDPAILTPVFTNGSRGDFVTVGPDGCMYATQTDRVVKVTRADGSCDWNPTGTLAGLALSPSLVLPNPPQGTLVSFTARFSNVAAPSGIPIYFAIGGANTSVHLVRADASGKAIYSYAGDHAGDDVLVATAQVAGLTLTSNPARVTWSPGIHATHLNLNLSATGGRQGRQTTLRAALFDVSLANAPIAGAPVHFAVGSASCDGLTDASGMASCSLAPTLTGTYTLTASYAGDSGHRPASQSLPFTVTDGPLPFADGFE